MKKLLLCVFCAVLTLTACVKPQEEPTTNDRRQANLERYLDRAKAATALDEQRMKVLSVPDIIDVALLTNQAQKLDVQFLQKAFERNRQNLQTRLQRAYATEVTKEIDALFDTYKTQAHQIAQEAESPWSLASQIASLWMNQDKEIQEFISTQADMNRLKPNEAQQEKSHQYLLQRCDEFIERIEFYYGPDTATECRPILDKAVLDYVSHLANASSEQDLEDKTNELLTNTQQKIDQVLQQTGDPLGITSADAQASLRTQMILTQRKFEQTLESLYGKNAVLQARGVFNTIREQTDKELQLNRRLNQKKETLAYLNEDYKRKIVDLQTTWNQEFSLPAPVAETAPQGQAATKPAAN